MLNKTEKMLINTVSKMFDIKKSNITYCHTEPLRDTQEYRVLRSFIITDKDKHIGMFFKVNLDKSKTAVETAVSYAEIRASEPCPEGLSNVFKASHLIVESPVYIHQMIEFLNRTDKNCISLYGEKGVGKSSVVNALAHKIENKQVPSFLQNKQIFKLNMSELVLNIHNPREVSVKIQDVLYFIAKNKEDKILFVPQFEEIQKNTLVYENIKKAVVNDDITVIFEMNYDAYNSFKSDLQLFSQFNTIQFKEPTIEETISIIEKIAPQYELKQGIFIPTDSISILVENSAKYISGQFLPEKAINVLDQSCSALALSLQMASTEEVALESRISNMKINSKYNNDQSVIKDIEKLDSELISLKKLREDNTKTVKENSVLMNELAELETKEITEEIKTKVLELKTKIQDNKKHTTLGKMHICETISKMTDIPKEKIAQSKQDGIVNLATDLAKRVFGQEQGIEVISDTLITSYAGLTAEQKPLGSFLLLGPSGVGKTEIAKSLAELLFGNEKYLIRFDLSEYSEQHSVSKLIGAPAGYAGYDEGGVLTEAVRKNPYAIILFDEVEKAHPDFSNILLQLLDDGRLTDNKGRTVKFNNTIVFLTSNLKDPVAYFKPEVLGRFDSVITFNPLAKSVMPMIINKSLKALNKKLKKQGLTISLTQSLIDYLGAKGHSEKYGARPLISLFSQMVQKPLAKQMLSGTLQKGSIEVDIEAEKSVFKNKVE